MLDLLIDMCLIFLEIEDYSSYCQSVMFEGAHTSPQQKQMSLYHVTPTKLSVKKYVKVSSPFKKTLSLV